MKFVWVFLLALTSITATEKTGIDYDTSRGAKPLRPLFDYKSKLGFAANADGVKSFFSDLEVEEQKNQS